MFDQERSNAGYDGYHAGATFLFSDVIPVAMIQESQRGVSFILHGLVHHGRVELIERFKEVKGGKLNLLARNPEGQISLHIACRAHTVKLFIYLKIQIVKV